MTTQAGPRPSLHARVLRLRHVRLRAWQLAALLDGSFLLAGLLVLADVASAWALVVLPALLAAVVKAHDVVAGLLLPGTPTAPAREDRRRRGDRED